MASGGFGKSRGPIVAGIRPTSDAPVTIEPDCDVVLTRDHEYFVLQGLCVAVRERASGRFVRQDLANGVASLHRGQANELVRNVPRIGEWLCLERGGVLHYVGPVIGCERRRLPSHRIVAPVLRRAKLGPARMA